MIRSLVLEWGIDYSIWCNGIVLGLIVGILGLYKLNLDEVVVLIDSYIIFFGKFGEKWDIVMFVIFFVFEIGSFYFEKW